MSLKSVYAKLSDDSLRVDLIHRESGKLLESLPIQPATQEHRAFILATWVRSYAAHARKLIAKTIYTSEEPKIAEKHWDKCYVVTSPDDSYVIHAWICSTGPKELLHVYVVPELRRKGIAGALIEGLCGRNVQYGRPWPYPETPPGWTYNPYILSR